MATSNTLLLEFTLFSKNKTKIKKRRRRRKVQSDLTEQFNKSLEKSCLVVLMMTSASGNTLPTDVKGSFFSMVER